ncbi:MFS transporter [Rhodococcus sp. IEGM 1307]|uniref:MFS transporter n=1 Tax=Rhodococcus sp. IEGM 1307 TaxID=3047091 RepID=UPI0024B69470|nr:MFS transporter [Rhodococcus sp. IEGM 1307]MDI9979567.1 MFS transporter [Rhodococcus sp. IEGM 1307]
MNLDTTADPERQPANPFGVQAEPIDVASFVDSQPVGRFHLLLLALGGSVMCLDGFDTQAISFAAPSIAREWGLPVSALGPILSAAIAGLMAGYLVLSPLANRFGHRRLVLVCTAVFAVLTLLCAAATSPEQLIVLRFLTGTGLGGAIPSIVALVSEFAPRRRRSSFVMFIYCWLALGFVAAGIISGFVIPTWGWRSMFVVGGVLPLVLLAFLLRYFPESPNFLIKTGAHDRALATLRRLAPSFSGDIILRETNSASMESGTLDLIRGRWAIATGLLWIAFIGNLGVFYGLQSWLPTIVTSSGHSRTIVIAATVLTTIGGIVAAGVIGPIMDRTNPFRTLSVVYLGGALLTGLMGFVLDGASTAVLLGSTFLAGTCVVGGQMSVTALATVVYPPVMRPAGVGWALGVGRIGGVMGPLLVGWALGADLPTHSVFAMMGLILVGAGLSVFMLERTMRNIG